MINEDYFFADLVFYHRILKCHVIVELKINKFCHEYASQLNMYLNYFKAEVMQPDNNPPIDILLCTEKGDTFVKYATAELDPNIFVQKYMIELPQTTKHTSFLSKTKLAKRKNSILLFASTYNLLSIEISLVRLVYIDKKQTKLIVLDTYKKSNVA